MGKLKRFWTEKLVNFFKDIKKMRNSDLIFGMIRVMVVGWLIPYLAISIALLYSSGEKSKQQISDTVTASMENAALIAETAIESAIKDSKQASYDGVIKSSYSKYLKTGNEKAMYDEITAYLKNAYQYSTVIYTTNLLFYEGEHREYFTFSTLAGATYSDIGFFRHSAMNTVMEVAQNLGTETKLVAAAGRLYIVRNIVNNNYKPFAVFVVEVDVDDVFASMDNVVWRKDGMTFLGNSIVRNSTSEIREERIELFDDAKENILKQELNSSNDIICEYDETKNTVSLAMNINGQRMSYIVRLDKNEILSEHSLLYLVYLLVIILLIPLLLATIYYFYSNISKPIMKLVEASEILENGEFGYQIEMFDRNEEFGKLIDTFNNMSESLEDSFNRIYAEEVAVRDANMQALQAQINPHFLNNTLEIINWKARIAGNDDVSGMIESLGVMMEATMNRNNESFVTIKEELKYVDAYLYIIVQRFGSKFQFEKNVDENLLSLKIPRLIVQPLVENMVEHGCDMYGNRTGKLMIYENDTYLYIVVENIGDLSEADKAKISLLLSDEKIDGKLKNIGIRNVNLRLKMLYGEYSGLTITNEEKGKTVSKIIIDKRRLENNDNQ